MFAILHIFSFERWFLVREIAVYTVEAENRGDVIFMHT